MRVAIVSDIHGNRTAFDAVLEDLKETAPDQILFGGDLADSGSSPVYIVDRIRELGWRGVVGNTDELLFDSASLKNVPAIVAGPIDEMASFSREALGDERLAWLRSLPRAHADGGFSLVHASPGSLWKAPGAAASDEELEVIFGELHKPLVVYGHIHSPYIRSVSRTIVANTGSVSLSHDGDPRASYLLLDDLTPSTRRVAYDVERELKALATCGLPYADWVSQMLKSGRPQLP